MTARYRFISTHRATYGVQRICRVLDIRWQAYYEWLETADADADADAGADRQRARGRPRGGDHRDPRR